MSVNHLGVQPKRKRACHMCRQRRRRCDGGEPCSHCVYHNFACTYANSLAETVLSDPYVESLKARLELAEQLLQKARQNTGPLLYFKAMRSLVEPFVPHPDDSVILDDFAESFRSLSLEAPAGFQGKSSTAILTKTAVAEKAQGRVMVKSRSPTPSTSEGWTLQPLHTHTPSLHDFPEEHLMSSLVSLYFLQIDPFLPLLERGRFEEGIKQRLYEHNSGFASTLLLVCALGLLYSTDPGPSAIELREQLAWKFYNQVELCGHSLRRQPTLYDLQSYSLAAHFLHCTANIRTCWSIVGFGLCLAQDVGAHRRKPTEPITVEEELEKRALWILLLFEAQLSGALGRPTELNPFEIHITLPSQFLRQDLARQPPTDLAFFRCYLNLYRLENFVLRLVNATFDVPVKALISPLSLVQVDALLNQWFKSIPKHLSWDPNQTHALLFDQSATLHCLYYYTLMLLHRPAAPIYPTRPPDLSLPVDPICKNAARECIRVANIHRSRRPHNPLLFNKIQVFDAAMVLLLDAWNDEGDAAQAWDDIARVRTAIEVLKSQQQRWPAPGPYIGVLERLISLDDNSETGVRENPSSESHQPFDPADGRSLPNLFTLPPVFVGDEDILPGRARRWHATAANLGSSSQGV